MSAVNPAAFQQQIRSDSNFMAQIFQNWECASKTEAEVETFEYVQTSGLDVASVCPTLVLGPMMQATINSSSLVLIKLLKGVVQRLSQAKDNIAENKVEAMEEKKYVMVNSLRHLTDIETIYNVSANKRDILF